MSSVASIQLSSGPNIRANLLEVSKYLEEISKTQSKLVVLPENFALMPEDDLSFLDNAEDIGSGPIQEFISESAKKYKLWIIEDACHALGAKYKYKNKFLNIGSCRHADVSTFSLHPLKTITSGEGGIITTNNAKIAKNIQLFRSHGISRGKKYWEYNVLKHGYNYRLSDLNCALGLSQLDKIGLFLKMRKRIYLRYINSLKNYNIEFQGS